MPHRMSDFIKAALIVFALLLAFIISWPIFDFLLPRTEMDSRVIHIDRQRSSLTYHIYGTAGAVGKCSITPGNSQQLQQGAEFIALRTPIFGRCVGAKPITCNGLLCSSGDEGDINANSLLDKAIQNLYGDRYLTVNGLVADYLGYAPEVRRWPNVRSRIPPTRVRYSVRMPDRLVIFDSNGEWQTSRSCGTVEGLCRAVSRVSRGASGDSSVPAP